MTTIKCNIKFLGKDKIGNKYFCKIHNSKYYDNNKNAGKICWKISHKNYLKGKTNDNEK